VLLSFRLLEREQSTQVPSVSVPLDEWGGEGITKCEAIDSALSAKTIGCSRCLNDCFNETLVALDDVNHSFSYTINSAPGTPVDASKDYLSTWKFYEVTNPVEGASAQTFVVQTSVWTTGDTQAILDFCNPIYRSVIMGLKAYVEKK